MSRAQMGARCPGATAVGIATLEHWRFIIGVEGHGSIAPSPGAIVHGVLWRTAAREIAAINAYENVASGLYLRRVVAVRHGASLLPALAYVLRRRGEGRPRPGYIHLVVEAARDWGRIFLLRVSSTTGRPGQPSFSHEGIFPASQRLTNQ